MCSISLIHVWEGTNVIIFNLLKLGMTLKKMKFNTYMTILGLEMLVN